MNKKFISLFLLGIAVLPIIKSTATHKNLEVGLESIEDDFDIEEYLIFKKKCEQPDCKIFRRSKLYPHKNPQKYWQCKRKGLIKWQAKEIDCTVNGYKFDYKKQECVDPEQKPWKSVCKGGNTTPYPTTTEETTTLSSTESTSIETDPPSTTEEITTETDPISTSEITSSTETDNPTTTEDITETDPITTSEITSSTKTDPLSTTAEVTTEFSSTESSSTDTESTETSTEITSSSTSPPIPTLIPMPDPMDCDSHPSCLPNELLTLFPMRDPTRFYKCELQITETGASWHAVQKDCPIAINGIKQYFSFLHQNCLDPLFWSDVCMPDGPACIMPKCFNNHRKYPDVNPRDYYECVEGVNGDLYAKRKTCATSLLFGYDQQTCVNVTEWQDPCRQVNINTSRGFMNFM